MELKDIQGMLYTLHSMERVRIDCTKLNAYIDSHRNNLYVYKK